MGDQGFTDFDVWGMNDLGANDIWATDTPIATGGPAVNADPLSGLDPGFIDNVSINPATGQLSFADGSALPPDIDAALRQSYGLAPAGANPTDMGFPAGSVPGGQSAAEVLDNQVNDSYNPQVAQNLSPKSLQILAEREAELSPDAAKVAAGQPPSDPNFWAKANSIVEAMTGTALGRLGTVAAGSLLSLLAQKAFVKTATYRDPFRAGTSQFQNPLFQTSQGALAGALAAGGATDLSSALRSNLEGNKYFQQLMDETAQREAATNKEQAPGERNARMTALNAANDPNFGDPILANERAQMLRVMAGQYSNPLLDAQEQQQQETLSNDWFHRGGRDALAESTGGQRAQMFQNLQNQANREADRRSVLSQYQGDTNTRATSDLARLGALMSLGRTAPATIGAAVQNPPGAAYMNLPGAAALDSQRASGIINGAYGQYQNQNAGTTADRTAIGNVFGQILGQVRGETPQPTQPTTNV